MSIHKPESELEIANRQVGSLMRHNQQLRDQLDSYRIFVVSKNLTDEYLAWRVVNRMEGKHGTDDC